VTQQIVSSVKNKMKGKKLRQGNEMEAELR
jgi:hypothetical protein